LLYETAVGNANTNQQCISVGAQIPAEKQPASTTGSNYSKRSAMNCNTGYQSHAAQLLVPPPLASLRACDLWAILMHYMTQLARNVISSKALFCTEHMDCHYPKACMYMSKMVRTQHAQHRTVLADIYGLVNGSLVGVLNAV
jgi:hypothetical protein